MTPAGRLAVATRQADQHAAGCVYCHPPSPERSMTAHCRTGHALDQAWMRAWRIAIDALTGVA